MCGVSVRRSEGADKKDGKVPILMPDVSRDVSSFVSSRFEVSASASISSKLSMLEMSSSAAWDMTNRASSGREVDGGVPGGERGGDEFLVAAVSAVVIVDACHLANISRFDRNSLSTNTKAEGSLLLS